MSEAQFDPWARRRARRLLLQALYQWQVSHACITDIERQFAERHGWTRIDRPFFKELLRGIVGGVQALDADYAPLLDRDVASLDIVERALLRMGTFELGQRLDVPAKVVIDEAVHLAREFGAEDSHRYVNAVLDKLARRHRPRELGDG